MLTRTAPPAGLISPDVARAPTFNVTRAVTASSHEALEGPVTRVTFRGWFSRRKAHAAIRAMLEHGLVAVESAGELVALSNPAGRARAGWTRTVRLTFTHPVSISPGEHGRALLRLDSDLSHEQARDLSRILQTAGLAVRHYLAPPP